MEGSRSEFFFHFIVSDGMRFFLQRISNVIGIAIIRNTPMQTPITVRGNLVLFSIVTGTVSAVFSEVSRVLSAVLVGVVLSGVARVPVRMVVGVCVLVGVVMGVVADVVVCESALCGCSSREYG